MTHPAHVTDRRPNPFADAARGAGACVAWRDGRLERVPADAGGAQPDEVPPFVEFVHDSFRSTVLHRHFSCVGAKTALHAGTYRLGVYDEMASRRATAALARDLFAFVQDHPADGAGFATFVATFTSPAPAGEEAFEERLWAQLRALHALDREHHAWDPAVSADPQDPGFAFSFAERAFFVVGLHPGSSRWARRFAWPTLVFNPHSQFQRLREEGKFQAYRDAIRRRDLELQGSLNPVLADHGEASDARQYSGRAVDSSWRCPFPHAEAAEKEGDA